MGMTCKTCAHPERKIIDAMIASKEPYLQIATKFGLNQKSVNTHGKNHVQPFIESLELQANAAVLERVMSYRDVVNLPLPEKAKSVENKLWADYEQANGISERMTVIREIQKQQAEQAKLAGAYTTPAENPKNLEAQRTIDIENLAAILESQYQYSPEVARERAELAIDTVRKVSDAVN